MTIPSSPTSSAGPERRTFFSSAELLACWGGDSSSTDSPPSGTTRKNKRWVLPVDPARLAINRQMGKRYIPKDVNRAMDEIAWQVRLDPPAWTTDPTDWRVWVCFRFQRRTSDVDGPLKRTLDALAIGLQARDLPFDDRDVIDLRMQKRLGDPRIIIDVEAL